MTTVEGRKPGRPGRSEIDSIKAATWANTIWPRRYSRPSAENLNISKAIGCPDPARQAARWYKYMHGLTTPSHEVVEAVGRCVRGTVQVFNHPLWVLVEHPSLTLKELRSQILLLDEFADWITDRKPTTTSDALFWRLPGLNHREVIKSLLSAVARERVNTLQYLGSAGVLVALIRDAELGQRQVQHFEAHVGLVRHLQVVKAGGLHGPLWLGKVEALLIERWLTTEYRVPKLQQLMQHFAMIDHSAVLRRGADSSLVKGTERHPKSFRGQWVMEEITRNPPSLGHLTDW